MTIEISHVTETGTAEMVAEDIAGALDAPAPVALAARGPAGLTAGPMHLIICATYGEGELPAAGRPFAEALDQGARVDGARFAIFGLGDRSYETFAGGADMLRRALLAAGAVEVAPIVRHDASGPDLPEDAAIAWAQGLADEVGAAA